MYLFSFLNRNVGNGNVIMDADVKLFSIAQTARKLGGISRNIVLKEIDRGHLKACYRGDRMYCSNKNIEEYERKHEIDNSVLEIDYKSRFLRKVRL